MTDAGVDGSAKDAETDASADADAGPTCPKNLPLTAADLDKEYGWNPAVKSPGSCSAADLATFENDFKLAGAKPNYVALGAGLSASCQACVISFDTDASWGPIVATKADNGATGTTAKQCNSMFDAVKTLCGS